MLWGTDFRRPNSSMGCPHRIEVEDLGIDGPNGLANTSDTPPWAVPIPKMWDSGLGGAAKPHLPNPIPLVAVPIPHARGLRCTTERGRLPTPGPPWVVPIPTHGAHTHTGVRRG